MNISGTTLNLAGAEFVCYKMPNGIWVYPAEDEVLELYGLACAIVSAALDGNEDMSMADLIHAVSDCADVEIPAHHRGNDKAYYYLVACVKKKLLQETL